MWGRWKHQTCSPDIVHVFILFPRPQIVHMGPLSPTSPIAVASSPLEPSSNLLWVVLGGNQRSKMAPTHRVLDSKDEAKNVRVIFPR